MKKLTFHIFCLLTVIGCAVLGIWQIDRLQWKENLITQVAKFKDQQPEEFSIKNYDPEKDLFKKVYLFGAFQNDQEMLLDAKYFDESREKASLGYHVITPFITTEGVVVFVNRGWIPEDMKDQDKRKDSLVTALIETPLEGMIRESHGEAPWYMPHNVPEKNVWFWIDLPEMTKKLKEDSDIENANIKPILIQQTVPTAFNDFKYPVPISGDIEFYNQHMIYIITWFSLAFVVLGMWAWWSKKQG